MDWIKTFTIIGSMIGVMGFFFRRVHKDIESINGHISRLDRNMVDYERRIDHLYQVICDMLKDRK